MARRALCSGTKDLEGLAMWRHVSVLWDWVEGEYLLATAASCAAAALLASCDFPIGVPTVVGLVIGLTVWAVCALRDLEEELP